MASMAADDGADGGAEATGCGRYTRGAIWFHWTIAALIIVNIVIGLFHDAFPRGSMGYHKAIGITVLFLSLGRLAWRLTHRPPSQSRHHKPWERFLAKATHRLFYVAMIAVPLAGWLTVSAATERRPLTFFGLFDLPYLPVAQSAATGGFFHEAHELMAFATIGLLLLHIAGALKHQLIDRDGELARMGVGRSARQ